MTIIDKIKEKILDSPTVSICMLGPRAVGKTTVLTSIFAQSQEKVGETRIYMCSANKNAAELAVYKTQLEDTIAKRDASRLPATNGESDVLFHLGVLGKPTAVKLAIKDYPGEYLNSKDPEKQQRVKDFVEQSHIILVAIDTPYLIEENGAYNAEKNMPQLVKDYLTSHIAEVTNKLILFIPLKCERYYHDGRIDEVTNRVMDTYGDLLSFFKQHNIASVIAPILTLGGIELDHMTDNVSGQGTISKLPVFRMYADKPEYAPLYCSQPFYYLLTYVACHYKWQRNQASGILKRMRNSLNSFLTKDRDFLNEINKMHKYILTNGNGYRVITGNSIIKLT